MARPLILVGGGGHCRSVIEAAESAGLEIAGILDMPGSVGSDCLGYKVVGTDDDIPRLAAGHDFVVTLGFINNPVRRIAIHNLIIEAGGTLATVVASTARVSRHASVGQGTVILHHAMVNAGATVGMGCIINTGADIEHDVAVADHCHISTGATINGGCTIGSRTFVGSGATVINGIEIAPDTIVGAGAVVCRNLGPGTYAGVPARKI